jgi:Flp pilus assembly protein TadD
VEWSAATVEALAPDAASVCVELARAELALGHTDAALRALEATSTRDAEMLRGAAYSQQRDWRRAADAYQRATKLGPATIELLNALGNAQLEAGRLDEAAATLEQSLAIEANQPQIRVLLDRARRLQSKSRP